MTTYMESLCDLRKSAIEKYVTITYRRNGETYREEVLIFASGYTMGVARWSIRTYLPGRGPYQVGDRLRYKGKNNPAYPNRYVEDVPIGTLATITKDYGFDSRYMFEFDQPTSFHIWSSYPDGQYKERTGMRTSGYGWEKIA